MSLLILTKTLNYIKTTNIKNCNYLYYVSRWYMKLENRQLEMQEAILLKLHHTKNISDAKILEIKKWCIINWYEALETEDWCLMLLKIIDNSLPIVAAELLKWVVWLPPTLPRVLTAFGDQYYYRDWFIVYEYKDRTWYWWIPQCERKLLNEDRTPCDLFLQSKETQRAIYDIIVWKW